MNYDLYSKKPESRDSISEIALSVESDDPAINSKFVKIDLKSPISLNGNTIESINGEFIQNTNEGSLFEPIGINSVRRFRIDYILNGIYLLVYSNDGDLSIIESKMTSIDWIDENGLVVKSEERNNTIVDLDDYEDEISSYEDTSDLEDKFNSLKYKETIDESQDKNKFYNERTKSPKIL